MLKVFFDILLILFGIIVIYYVYNDKHKFVLKSVPFTGYVFGAICIFIGFFDLLRILNFVT